MRKALALILFYPFMLLSFISSAQDDMEFRDGLYFSFKDFRNNDPLVPESIYAENISRNDNFLKEVTSREEVVFQNYQNQRESVSLDEIWGYANNNNIYLNIQNGFHRLLSVGRLSHFVAQITVYTISPGNMSPYYGFGQNATLRVPSTELKQFILDYDSGKIFEFSIENLEEILKREPELFLEFQKLNRRKKKEQLMYFLRKYNERNPVVFPQ